MFLPKYHVFPDKKGDRVYLIPSKGTIATFLAVGVAQTVMIVGPDTVFEAVEDTIEKVKKNLKKSKK